jgi:chromosome partitioning protein
MALVICLANQKGGVGKTAGTLGLAAAAAHLGARVLLIDMDPQASASKVLGIEDSEYSMTDLMMAEGTFSLTDPDTPVVVPLEDWGFDLAPADIGLARREQNQKTGAETKLRSILRASDLDRYDLVFIDCPPSLGLLTVNALAASDFMLVVTQPAFAAMRGLTDLLLGTEIEELGRVTKMPSTFDVVRDTYAPDLKLAGFIVNMMDGTNDARGYLSELQEAFPGEVWDPAIPVRAAMKESYTSGKPLYRLNDSKGGTRQLRIAFEELAKRLMAFLPDEAPDFGVGTVAASAAAGSEQ